MDFPIYLEKLLQEKSHLKQVDISKRMGLKTAGMIYQWRTGRRPAPEPEVMEKLAESMECTAEEKKRLMSYAYQEALGSHANVVDSRRVSEIYVPQKNYTMIPLLGSCPASAKEWMDDEVIEWIEFPKSIVKDRRMYLVKVIGDSMNKMDIDPGDTLLIDADKQPENGDIVVICIDHEFTIKVFKRSGSSVTLEPASYNPKHAPATYDARDCDIRLRGVVWKIWMKDPKRR